MATTENAWRELPTEVLNGGLAASRAMGWDTVKFHTFDWAPNAVRCVPVAEVEGELVARARCD